MKEKTLTQGRSPSADPYWCCSLCLGLGSWAESRKGSWNTLTRAMGSGVPWSASCPLGPIAGVTPRLETVQHDGRVVQPTPGQWTVCVPVFYLHYLTLITVSLGQGHTAIGDWNANPSPSHCSTHLVWKTRKPEELPFLACLWSRLWSTP